MELDETLTSREVINTKMRASLDVATDPWGIKVNRVELKNIIPPAAIQEAMEKQMKVVLWLIWITKCYLPVRKTT